MTSRKDMKQLIARINATPGYVVPPARNGKCHRRAYRVDADGEPVGHGVTLPSTPGDWNVLRNAQRDLKKYLDWHDPIVGRPRRQKKKRPKHRRPVTMPKTADAARHVTFVDAGTTATTAPAVDTAARAAVPGVESSRAAPPHLDKSNIRQGARYVWEYLRDDAAQHEGSGHTYQGAAGYKWQGRLPAVLTEIWPPLAHIGKKDLDYLVTRIKQVLIDGERIALLRGGNPVVPSTYFVRGYWDAPVPDPAPAPDVEPAPDITAPADNGPAGTPAVTPAGVPKDAFATPVPDAPQTSSIVTSTEGGETEKKPSQEPAQLQPTRGRITVDDLVSFAAEHERMLAEHERMLAERDSLRVLAADMVRAGNAILEKLGGRLE